MRAFYVPLIAGAVLALLPTASQAVPLSASGSLAGAVAQNDLMLAHHKPGHRMKARGHGRHLGWTRGKHKGWSKHRR